MFVIITAAAFIAYLVAREAGAYNRVAARVRANLFA